MNTANFDKLFTDQAETAKALFDPMALKNIAKMSKQEAEELIEKNQITIPPALLGKIKLFIERKRKDGIAEDRIKRLVKKKFHVTVI